MAKTKALTSFAVTAKLVCAFVFADANCWFSDEVAHIKFKQLSTIETTHVARKCFVPKHACPHIRVSFLIILSIALFICHGNVYTTTPFFFFYSVLRPFQDYFSSYETGQSVGGAKTGES